MVTLTAFAVAMISRSDRPRITYAPASHGPGCAGRLWSQQLAIISSRLEVGQHAAVHGEVSAGNEIRVRRHEEQDRLRHVFGSAPPAQRNVLGGRALVSGSTVGQIC